jgi:hypothetical protein
VSAADGFHDFTVPQWLRHIRSEWGISDEQLAGLVRVDLDVIAQWTGPETPDFQGTVPPGLDAAVPLIAIYRKLAARFPESDEQVKWLFSEHRDFGGSKPIDVAMSSLENLYWVGYFLDSSTA